jgi:KipI family sensor histidine kinase inhibitor
MEIIPLGDAALIVRVREQFDDAPDETLDQVLRTFQQLQTAALPGVVDLAPAYTSIAVFYDPISVVKTSGTPGGVFDYLATRIRAALSGAHPGDRIKRLRSRVVEIPVCYDSEFAPDLDDVARHAHMSTKEVVELHTGAEYRVACIGFVPGFPFLAGLPKKLATPRQPTPRREIPPGSVRLESDRTNAAKALRSERESACAFARRRPRVLPSDHAGRV